MRRVSTRGQSIGEYAILFAIVLGAIVAMQAFVRDRIAGKIQNEATAAKMPIIARLAARAVTEVDALRKRSVADQVKIDQLRKDIRKLSERKATDP